MLRFTDDNKVLREDRYNAILVGVQRDEDISYSMEELEGLCRSGRRRVLGTMIQNMERPNTATLIGKGKVEELERAGRFHGSRYDNLQRRTDRHAAEKPEDAIGIRIIDTILILDIFAAWLHPEKESSR